MLHPCGYSDLGREGVVTGFVVRRLVHAVVVVVGVTGLVFVVTRVIGDPARAMLPLSATDEQRRQFESVLGLDQPILTQLWSFVEGLLRFDLGDSLWQRRPAFEVIMEALPRTFVLITASVAVALFLALVLGTVAALRPGSVLDRGLIAFSVVGLSIPQFWLGLMLVIVFAVQVPIFPTSGTGSAMHLVLPALTMALPQLGRLSMMVRSAMLEVLSAEYMTVLTLKGLPVWRRLLIHGFRNAAPSILTLAAWEYVQGLAGYAVVVETVFAWPGVGYLAFQAIGKQDLTLLSALVLITALVVVLINTTVDLIYTVLDPRASTSGGR